MPKRIGMFKMRNLEKSKRSNFELKIAESLDVRKRIEKGLKILTFI